MARQITKEHAKAIVNKLRAKKAPGKQKAHDLMLVIHEGRIIATISIRRGSQKDSGHDHIPRDLHVSPNFAKGLAQCPKSRADWIAEMAKQGLV